MKQATAAVVGVQDTLRWGRMMSRMARKGGGGKRRLVIHELTEYRQKEKRQRGNKDEIKVLKI